MYKHFILYILNLKYGRYLPYFLLWILNFGFNSSLNAQKKDSTFKTNKDSLHLNKVKDSISIVILNGIKNEYSSIQTNLLKTGQLDTSLLTPGVKFSKDSIRINDKVSVFAYNLSKGCMSILDKASIKIKKPNIKIGGSIENQSYATNTQNPFLIGESVYSRFYFKPTISIYSIPLKIDGFYTTETSGMYRNSYFRVSLDMEALQSAAKGKMEETLKAKQREYTYKVLKAKPTLDQENKAKLELSKTTNSYANADRLTNDAKRQLEKEKQKAVDQQNHINDSLENLAQNNIDNEISNVKQMNDSIEKSKTDSLNNSCDSITNCKLYGKAAKTIDSLQNVYNSCLKRKENLQRQKDSVENNYSKISEQCNAIKGMLKGDSLSIEEYRQMIKNPGSQITKRLPNSIDHFKITRLAIGQVAPTYAEFGLNGIPVKGGEIMVQSGNLFIGTTLGKTTNTSDFFSLNASSPKYDKRLGALIVGYNSGKNRYYLHSLNISEDKKNNEQKNYHEENTVFTVGAEMKFKKNLRFIGELAASRYSRLPINTTIEYKGESPVIKPSFNNSITNSTAARINLEYDLTNTTVISTKYERIGESFKDLGNPFLRRDFLMKELKFTQTLFKNKLKTEAFYKEGSDNVSKEKNYTNRNKGFGFKARTSFSRYPNIMLMYSPFQFGNNHPDSNLRTRSQFSFLMATLTWYKTMGRTAFNTIASYNNSKQSFETAQDVSVSQYTISQSLNPGKKFKLNFQLMYSKTFPSVDSINCFSQMICFSHLANSKLTWNLNLDNVSYFHHGFKRGGSLGCSILLTKNSNISLQGGLSQIHKIWGKSDMLVVFARVGVIWKL